MTDPGSAPREHIISGLDYTAVVYQREGVAGMGYVWRYRSIYHQIHGLGDNRSDLCIYLDSSGQGNWIGMFLKILGIGFFKCPYILAKAWLALTCF